MMRTEKDSEITHYHRGDDAEHPSRTVTLPRSKSTAPNNQCSPVCFTLVLGWEENWERAGPHPRKESVGEKRDRLSDSPE